MWDQLLESLFKIGGDGFLKSFAAALFAVLVANPIRSIWERWRYGGWLAVVVRDGQAVVERVISPRKLKTIQADESDLSVFLKGVVSPYGRIHVDLISEGPKCGLLTIDRDARRYVVDLDKNPPADDTGRT